MGAYFAENEYYNSLPKDICPSTGFTSIEKYLIANATLQAEVTHCHPEGIAGSITITSLAFDVANSIVDYDLLYKNLLRRVPQGEVWDGIKKASELPKDTPVGKLREILGNGTHVTCQDTVPFCCFMAIKHVTNKNNLTSMYENAIIETSMAFGDVDTNCAIVGGIVGIISTPPEKWVQFCQPMEGLFVPPVSKTKI